LPYSDIDLRNKCLEKSGPFSFEGDNSEAVEKVGKQIADIYRKEADYSRRINELKKGYSHELDESFSLISNLETNLVSFKKYYLYLV
jgi:hypothetical protein